jgi:TRAP-type mannitol/chloroaromatic compound transport system permease small subunit
MLLGSSGGEADRAHSENVRQRTLPRSGRILGEAALEVTKAHLYTKAPAGRKTRVRQSGGGTGVPMGNGVGMQALLGLSRAIDAVNTWIGRHVAWLILIAAIISAGNAIIRKLFDTSSNAWLEVQWWLFGLAFLLAAPWTLKDNDHIRIDIVSAQLSQRTRNIIEVIGHVFFLLPTAALILYTSYHYAAISWLQNEQSKDAGGLPQWPIKALIPLAFALLFAQGLSELIKRIAIMRGDIPEPKPQGGYHEAVTAAVVPKE